MKIMRKTLLPIAFALGCGAVSARADVVLSFVVNTQSLAGTNGYVDFQFNPGVLSTQSATVDVKNFAGATYAAGTQMDTGGASGGPLPGTVAITNSTVYNDDNEGVKFGSTMTFTLDFTGSAINSPNGTALSGSSFAFSLFDATDVTPLLTNDPNGFAAVVNVNTNGSLTTTTPSGSVAVLPEPASWLMMGGALSLLGVYRRRTR
jgi:hypothetical protein